MRKKIVAANWKMNGSQAWLSQYFKTFLAALSIQDTTCIFFPPYPYIGQAMNCIARYENCAIGGQNCADVDSGAYTGEISAVMLKDMGCRYALVGHSERRQMFFESEKIVAEKFHRVKEHGMIPVLCIGETLEERKNGSAAEVVLQQLSAVSDADKKAFDNCIIAYEPVWAIGTGQTATAQEAQDMHASIRETLTMISDCDTEKVSIIYGGSVNENTAAALFSMPDVDGGLVGGASLDAQKFLDIIECIK